MSRKKKKVYANITLEQANEASGLFADVTTRLTAVDAKMNAEINRVKDNYQTEITDLNELLEEPVAILEAFANEQKSTWGKKKSLDLLHTTVGFRTGMPKVTKDKRFTWEAITELVKKKFPILVRTKDELDKEAVIALTKDEKLFESVKEKCYLDVVQDETFYVDAKKETVSEVL